jgi:MFS family permease
MRGRVFYGWVVVAVTATVLLATAGIRAAPGAFLVSMQAQPGWTTASLSFAAAVGLIAYGLAGPISGRLMGAIGIRNVTLLSLALTAAALLAAVLVTDLWLLTLTFGLLSGLATGLVASVLGATVANRWF